MIGLINLKWKILFYGVIFSIISFFTYNYIHRGKEIENLKQKLIVEKNNFIVQRMKTEDDNINCNMALDSSFLQNEFISEMENDILEREDYNNLFLKIEKKEGGKK